MKNISRHNLISQQWIFLVSILVSAYWLIGNFTNIYSDIFTGAVFEILWLPMLALLFVIPVVAIIYWVKSRFQFNSLYFFSLLVISATLTIIIIRSYADYISI